MKKIFALGLAIVAGIGMVSPSQAAEFKSIAVIDSGFDSSLLGDSVLEEVCIVSISIGCNGAKSFDIGPGSSGSATKISARHIRDWNHGTQMADVIAKTNPDIKLVLIRNSKVFGSSVYAGNEADFAKALDWVSGNYEQYNIVGVSFSRGSHSYANSASVNKTKSLLRSNTTILNGLIKRGGKQSLIDIYTAKVNELQAILDSTPPVPCKVSTAISSEISELKALNIATFIATGNDGDKKNIDSPACVDDAVSVATLAKYGNSDGSYNLALNTNVSQSTDFATNGEFNTVFGFERDSSSIATAVLAGYWASVFDGSFDETYEYLKNSGGAVKDFAVVAVDVLK
jgi:hypothetical protein